MNIKTLKYFSDLHPAVGPEEKPDDTKNNNIRVVDKKYPALVQAEIFGAFCGAPNATAHDAVWRCGNGGVFKVHRLVLAMGSPVLR